MHSMQCRKNCSVEIRQPKKVASYINTHMTRLAQNQGDPINAILQYGSVVGRDCCVVFSASGNPYLILCSRQCKGKVATNYLQGLRTMKIFQYKNLLPLKPSQTTRSDIQHCNH